MGSKTKVTRKHQITIPKEIRQKAGIEVGDELRVVEKGDLIILEKVDNSRDLLSYAGCWNGYPKDADSFLEDLRKLWSTWKI